MHSLTGSKFHAIQSTISEYPISLWCVARKCTLYTLYTLPPHVSCTSAYSQQIQQISHDTVSSDIFRITYLVSHIPELMEIISRIETLSLSQISLSDLSSQSVHLKCYARDSPSCVGCKTLSKPSARLSVFCFVPRESGLVPPNISNILSF